MEHNSPQSTLNRIGFIGNHLPRQCGIATFTTDLCEAIAAEYSDTPPALPCPSTTSRQRNQVSDKSRLLEQTDYPKWKASIYTAGLMGRSQGGPKL